MPIPRPVLISGTRSVVTPANYRGSAQDMEDWEEQGYPSSIPEGYFAFVWEWKEDVHVPTPHMPRGRRAAMRSRRRPWARLTRQERASLVRQGRRLYGWGEDRTRAYYTAGGRLDGILRRIPPELRTTPDRRIEESRKGGRAVFLKEVALYVQESEERRSRRRARRRSRR